MSTTVLPLSVGDAAVIAHAGEGDRGVQWHPPPRQGWEFALFKRGTRAKERIVKERNSETAKQRNSVTVKERKSKRAKE